MLDSIFNVAVEVFKCLKGPIGRQAGYLRNYSSNLENLNKGIEKLMDARENIQQEVVTARKNGDEIKKSVEKWLINVDKKIDEAEKLIKEEEEANKKYFMGICPNLKKRYQLSKKAVTVEKAVVGFKEEAEKFEQISHRTVPEEAWFTSVHGYEAFDSRISTLKKIQNALSNPDISIVGVYGMAGVGKTELVKEVARQGKKDKLFEKVVFTEVSQAADTKKIQTEIAEKLDLELREVTESGRARRLYTRLKNEKKILVILDNMWKRLELETVGIPYGNDHKGCKVLLTARVRSVLSSMDSKDNFFVGVLEEEEAWRLFKKMAGDDAENRKLKSTAVNVAKACGGLPIAITAIARALRNMSVPQWENALRELRTPSSENFEGVPEEVYSSIELSYKYLKGKQLKKTFLLCSLITSYHSFSDLFKYGMGLGIFQGVNTMEDARNKLHALVRKLKDSCLLLEGDSIEDFSMHDAVRAVAISIACRDQHAFVVGNEDVRKWPNRDTLRKCTAISLRDSSIPQLPKGLECPQLEFFYMNTKDSSVKIPENFFTGLRKLRVVDLTSMQLVSLPSSFDVLTSLQTLCLDQGVFEDVAIIGKLKNLEILSFIWSDIVQLPKELGQLTKLRLLDLRWCSKLKVIAPHVISSLTRLEELYMSGCSFEWGVEGPNSERSNATLDELMHLPHLSALEIDITNENILPEGLLSKKMTRYQISIGNGYWYRFDSRHKSSRMLKLKLNSTSICSDNLEGIKDVECLCLDKLQGVENVLFKLDTNGFTQLKYLYVQNNPEFLCIVDSMERMPCDAFPLLESLNLHLLINLEKICRNELKAESFNLLNSIKVENCDKLRNIFSFSTSKYLPRLQKIAIINCDNMEEIFAIGGENDVNNNQVLDKIEFAQLTTLSLGSLPQLTCFYKVVKAQENLITSTSTRLFSEKVLLPNLMSLKLYESNVENIWHNELSAMSSLSFHSLTQLTVQNCHKLRCIFSSSIVKSFEQLQHLEISNCMALEENIAREEGAEAATSFELKAESFNVLNSIKVTKCDKLRNIFLFSTSKCLPRLQKISIINCGNMEEIFAIRGKNDTHNSQVFDKIEFAHLTSLSLRSLPQLTCFYKIVKAQKNLITSSSTQLFNEKVVLPNLESLELYEISVEKIWHNEFPAMSSSCFGSLTRLIVRKCHKLKCIFSSSMVKSFEQLQHIEIRDCMALEEIIAREGAEAATDFVFPQMTTLIICTLPELRCFYPGMHTSEWPVLEKLEVYSCDKMKIFASELISFSQGSQPLFLVEKIFLNLKELTVNQKGIAIIRQNEFPEHVLGNLKFLKVENDESPGFPLVLLERCHNLEKLELVQSSYEEIFLNGQVEIHAGKLAKIKNLRLFKLHELNYLWELDTKTDSILQSLEVLEVNFCQNLSNLWPSSASFQHLTALEVWHCDKLMNLMTSTTAKRLLQLVTMVVCECSGMTEVVVVEAASEGDAARDNIIFSKLKYLALGNLESLTSFCSGNCTFNFSCLGDLDVIDCPKMKNFSGGEVITPSVNVWYGSGEETLRSDDLNITVQQLHQQKLL